VFTLFVVPAIYVLIAGKRTRHVAETNVETQPQLELATA
jgi:hypothetical protein